MTLEELLQKYNVPVPRYTSYPPANYFSETFSGVEYLAAVEASNTVGARHLSFYIHIPYCRHLCHYCGCNSFAMASESGIDRYVAALHAEIDRIIPLLDPARRIAQIHYGGGTPTVLPVAILKDLNDHLLGAFDTIENPEIAIECHPAYADAKYWQDLTSAGFNRFSLGIQDFEHEVLRGVNRRPSAMPPEEILAILRSRGASINMDFLYGLPHQTAESFALTIERAAQLGPDRLVTFSYAHVPWVNGRQLILEKAGLPVAAEKSRMYSAAKEVLCAAGYRPIGLDHFVRPDDELYAAQQNKQLHRNFQGYCTRRTTGQVYAFGVSAISQLSGAYAQNDKNIQTYIDRIESGEPATVRGYALSPQEQITREVIETLMCNYSIRWSELAARLLLPTEVVRGATAYDEDKMCAFAADGIVDFDHDRIEMTSQGDLFVRNVAASLDRLMLSGDKSFSKPV